MSARYSLTYEFDELPVGACMARGSAEVEFTRDGAWRLQGMNAFIRDVHDDEMADVTPTIVMAIRRALNDDRRIQQAVNDELAELPSPREEAAADAADWRRE
jgi:hypothetical protein